MKTRLILALLLISFTSVVHSQDNKTLITAQTEVLKKIISSLNIDAPEKDIKANIEKDDLRFICICGYACYTPGVEISDMEFTKQYGSRCFEGTSDVIESEEHGKLIQTATQYAKQYNTALLKRLKLKTGP